MISDDSDFRVEAALEVLQKGDVIALPTDTVYGLAADATDTDAVLKLFELKDRPLERNIAVLVSEVDMAERLVVLSARARKLVAKFWPGPLTLVAKCKSSSPIPVLSGNRTLGVRLPDHELVRKLAASGPLAVTSANLHGEPTPATAQEVARLFPSLKIVIDGGCLSGVASTVVDVTGSKPVVLRKGPIPSSWF